MTAAKAAAGVLSPWNPDPLLAAAARTGGVHLLALDHRDQCWLVAHLAADGYTGEEIAACCHCGLRKVRYLMREPLTAMIGRWLVAQANADAHAHRADTLERWCRTSIADCETGASRARRQLDTAIDQIAALHSRCRAEQQRAALYLRYLRTGTHPPTRTRPAPCADQLALF